MLIKHHAKFLSLWKLQRHPTPNCIINTSPRRLMIDEILDLGYGLSNHILPTSVNDIVLKSAIEKKMYHIK